MTVEVERKFVCNAEIMGKLQHIGGVLKKIYSRVIYVFLNVNVFEKIKPEFI